VTDVKRATRACGSCGLPAIAGADRCLAWGGGLVDRRRPASPFGVTPGRSLRRAAAVLAVLAVASAVAVAWPGTPPPHAAPASPDAGLPAARVTLRVTSAPAVSQIVHLTAPDVQESCVGRPLHGDIETLGAPPAIIDSNPMSSWHCDGNGARLRPPQSLAVFFSAALTLTRVGVVGYDPLRPCRFVTAMELVVGTAGYRIPLPAWPYPQLRWFAVPAVRASQAELAVLATKVPVGRSGPNCARTAIAQIGFATGG